MEASFNTNTVKFTSKAYNEGKSAMTDISFSKAAIDAVKCTIGDRLPALSTRGLFNGVNKYSNLGIKI